MRELTEQEKKVIEVFTDMIRNEVDHESLVESIDNILWEFIQYRFEDPNFTGFENAYDDVYYLRQLRNVLAGKREVSRMDKVA